MVVVVFLQSFCYCSLAVLCHPLRGPTAEVWVGNLPRMLSGMVTFKNELLG